MTGFWNTANANAGTLRVNTIGDQQDAGHRNIQGAGQGVVPQAAAAGTTPAPTAGATAAGMVYPVYDGVTNALPGALPPDYATDQATFGSWHSGHQAQFITAQGGTYSIGPGANPTAFFRLDENEKPVNLLSLTLADYAKLSTADKTAFLADMTALGVTARLGLTTIKTAANSALTAAITSVNNLAASSGRFSAADAAVFTRQFDLIQAAVAEAPAIAQDKILLEVNDILARFERVKAFAESVQQVDVQTFTTSAQSATFVANWNRSVDASFMKSRVNSMDNGATIDAGLSEFMRAERAISETKQRRDAIAGSGSFRDPNLDVPNLIYKLQLLYEAEAEGSKDSGTEEIKQLHKLLQDYAVMQQLIARTLKTYNPAEAEEQRRFMNIGGNTDGSVHTEQILEERALVPNNESRTRSRINGVDVDNDYYGDRLPLYHWSLLSNNPARNSVHAGLPDGHQEGSTSAGLTDQEMRALSMFGEVPWFTNGGREHPIEVLFNGGTRPSFDFIDTSSAGANSLKLHRKTAFDGFQTQLSETITILNQQNQIKQNEIENDSKRQNRHFELGNNALRKMNDLLMSIGRM